MRNVLYYYAVFCISILLTTFAMLVPFEEIPERDTYIAGRYLVSAHVEAGCQNKIRAKTS